MKERPILFSGPMVQAILEGRKTQTRRLIKEPNHRANYGFSHLFDFVDGVASFNLCVVDGYETYETKCPYGQPGDKDWTTGPIPANGWYYVRDFIAGQPESLVYLRQFKFEGELRITWGWDEGDDPEAIEMDGGPTTETIQWKRPGDHLWVRETWRKQSYSFVDSDRNFSEYHYAADNTEGVNALLKWKPSIHMPRLASRILLEITGVRVERLQDITYEDAKAEGVERFEYDPSWVPSYSDPDSGGRGYTWRDYEDEADTEFGPAFSTPQESFQSLWQSINGPGSWNQNPWVWVIEFKRIEP